MDDMSLLPLSIEQKVFGEILNAFNEIQIPRSPYVLEKMVVGCHDTEEKQYSQCVLEMSIAWDNLRSAKYGAELTQIEIDELGKARWFESNNQKRKRCLEMRTKQVDLERLNRARLGAMREFEALFALWLKFPKKFTRKELNAAESVYWERRLTRQANQDMLAQGRIGQGNQDALRQIGKGVVPELDHVREVEQRYLAEGNIKILICVPSAEKLDKGIPCLDGLFIPATIQRKIYNAYGRQVADHYNLGAMEAVKDDADYLLSVETDTFPEPQAFVKLLELARKNPNCAVGAWYPKREAIRQGVHIVQEDGARKFLPDDGKVHECYTLAMGCSLFPVSMFLKIPQPWFVTTNLLSQDSFFSQLAREHGYKLLCDTKIRCRHVDPITKEVFE